MFEFHKDKKRYFDIQSTVTREYIIPFLKENEALRQDMHVLEIGCAEAGVLKAFLDFGCTGMGIELMENRADLAKYFLKEYISTQKARIVCKNIYDINPEEDLDVKFDLIILKDVIEHIPNQQKFIPFLKIFLKPGGRIMFGFPPWFMPFGGHQQICSSRFLTLLPWVHLLPVNIYKSILNIFGEKPGTIQELIEIKNTGISIERLKKILMENEFIVIAEKYWLFNPIYRWKFGLTPRTIPAPMTYVPFVRNFYTTALYILFEPK